MRIYNVHIHTITNQALPKNFLPFGLVRLLAKKKFTKRLAKLFNNLNPFSNNDILDRYAKFLTIGNLGSQEKIFNYITRFYPAKTVFCVLSVDLAYMNAGKVKQDYHDQLLELVELKKKYNDKILPFICVDPRRPGITELAIEFLEKHSFHGIKLYPALGYFPNDERLSKLYSYAEKKGVPIVAHCSKDGAYYKGKLDNSIFSEFEK